MTVSAHDVAREIMSLLPSAGDVAVQKLLYFCQGWHAAWTGRPLFGEEIQGWDLGPVVADLWHDRDKGRPAPPSQALDSAGLLVVEFVVSRYGRLSGRELIDLTHAQAPWVQATDHGRIRSARLDSASIGEYFAEDEGETAFEWVAEELRRRPLPPHGAPLGEGDEHDRLREMISR